MRTVSYLSLAVALIGAGFAASCARNANATRETSATDEAFDVLVVGSGAGGGTLASRLARAGKRVLLVEAGKDTGDSSSYRVPAMHGRSTEDAASAWWFFVKHASDARVDATDSKVTPEGVLYPRGSALGGSTAVNAMVTVLPARSDWNRLAALTGEPAFRADAMDAYVDRVREWLPVEQPDANLVLGDDQLSNVLLGASLALAARDGTPAVSTLSTLLDHDVNEALRRGETTGLVRLPLATKGGVRFGTRERVRDTMNAGYPLKLRTSTFVTRVLWDESTPPGDAPHAIGVEVASGDSLYDASIVPGRRPERRDAREQIFAREVVIAAGAFNSPQILSLSGVGDRNALAAQGIAVRAHVPGVGKNLQDRYEASVVAEFDAPIAAVASCALGESASSDPCLRDWNAGRGVYRTSGFLASMLVRSSGAGLADLQVFASPSDIRGYFPGYSRAATANDHRLSWLLLKAHTHNRDGEVVLRGANPFLRPEIHFHSWDEQNPLADTDLLALVEGVKLVRETQKQFRMLAPNTSLREVWPGAAVQSDAQIASFVRKEAWGHHACCTNKMGAASDESAVVDPSFRVRGTRGLRVIDASVFPEIPGTFIALPIMMLAERAADVMLQETP